MLPFKAFSHVSVIVTDLGKARQFYGELLGLGEIPRPAFDFPGAWYSLGGDVQLHVIVNEERPPRVEPFEIRYPHFALLVEDADDTHDRLSRSGYPFDDYHSTPTGMRQLFVRDADGNMVELLGPTRLHRERRIEG